LRPVRPAPRLSAFPDGIPLPPAQGFPPSSVKTSDEPISESGAGVYQVEIQALFVAAWSNANARFS
jgi:hypothetical protein